MSKSLQIKTMTGPNQLISKVIQFLIGNSQWVRREYKPHSRIEPPPHLLVGYSTNQRVPRLRLFADSHLQFAHFGKANFRECMFLFAARHKIAVGKIYRMGNLLIYVRVIRFFRKSN